MNRSTLPYMDAPCDECLLRGRNSGKTRAQFYLPDNNVGREDRFVCHSHLNGAIVRTAARTDNPTVQVVVIKQSNEIARRRVANNHE